MGLTEKSFATLCTSQTVTAQPSGAVADRFPSGLQATELTAVSDGRKVISSFPAAAFQTLAAASSLPDASSSHPGPGQRKHRASVSFVRVDLSTLARIDDPDPPVAAAAGQPMAVRIPGHRRDLISRAADGQDFLAAGRVENRNTALNATPGAARRLPWEFRLISPMSMYTAPPRISAG